MFALKTILISALAVAGVSAAPSPLKERAPVKAACPKSQGEYTENLSCPALQALGGFLNFQGDNVGATSKNVLEEVNKLLTQQSNPVTNIVQDLTQGTVTGLTNGATFALKAIGATIPELDEKCACNMVFCNSAIIDAQGMCNIGDAAAGTSQACGQALYSCAAFYSADQIATMTGGCCTPSNTK